MNIQKSKIYSVTELNLTVKKNLEDGFLPIWIEGEISNFMAHTSGHWYFTLKDKNSQVKCVMFNSYNKNASGIANGVNVYLLGKMSLYTARGDFQIIGQAIELAGDGALAIMLEKIKKKLADEGIFSAVKLDLPSFPKKIGVMSSPSGAVVHDIIKVIRRRYPLTQIIVYPIAVQGEAAVPSIIEAIDTVEKRHEIDVLIIARGGGSLEDLWAFNTEEIVRKIYTVKIPVVSAIGHEVDYTLVDLVADARAATPSVAAELVTPSKVEILNHITHVITAMVKHIKILIEGIQRVLILTSRRLIHPQAKLVEKMQRTDELCMALIRSMKRKLIEYNQINILRETLKKEILRKLEKYTYEVDNFVNRIKSISPISTLNRGYAIVKNTATAKVISSAIEVKPATKIEIMLSDGVLKAKTE